MSGICACNAYPASLHWHTAGSDGAPLVVLSAQYHGERTTPRQRSATGVEPARENAASLSSRSDASVLLLSGEPLNEPDCGLRPICCEHETRDRAVRDFKPGRLAKSETQENTMSSPANFNGLRPVLMLTIP